MPSGPEVRSDERSDPRQHALPRRPASDERRCHRSQQAQDHHSCQCQGQDPGSRLFHVVPSFVKSFRMLFSALLRGSINSWPQPKQRSLISMPTRRISHWVLPQGWSFSIPLCRADAGPYMPPVNPTMSAAYHTLSNTPPSSTADRMGYDMPMNSSVPPEGLRPPAAYALQDLRDAMESGAILEGTVQRCDTARTLHVPARLRTRAIPKGEAVAPWISGAGRDIALLSRVGRTVCFTVQAIHADEKGAPVALLSRRKAQERAMDHFLASLEPGAVLTCRVTRLETFGVFLDMAAASRLCCRSNVSQSPASPTPPSGSGRATKILAGSVVHRPGAPPHHHDPPGAAGDLDGERQPVPAGRDGAGHRPKRPGVWQLHRTGPQPLRPGGRPGGACPRRRRRLPCSSRASARSG